MAPVQPARAIRRRLARLRLLGARSGSPARYEALVLDGKTQQEKIIKFNTLLANCVIFHTALDMTAVLRQLASEGWPVTPAAIANLSPYITERIKRFGEYATDGLTEPPAAFDPRLNLPRDGGDAPANADIAARARTAACPPADTRNADLVDDRVELIGGGGRTLWPRPGRVFAAARSHTFLQLGDAIDSKTRPGLRAGMSAPSALDRARRVAQNDREARFTALLHHVDIDRLRVAYGA